MPPWIRSCCLLIIDKILITGACKLFTAVLSTVVVKAPLAPLGWAYAVGYQHVKYACNSRTGGFDFHYFSD